MAEIEWKTKAEIENEPQPVSKLDELKKQQTDLVYTLLINGVI